jgi:hypothetical protein
MGENNGADGFIYRALYSPAATWGRNEQHFISEPESKSSRMFIFQLLFVIGRLMEVNTHVHCLICLSIRIVLVGFVCQCQCQCQTSIR